MKSCSADPPLYMPLYMLLYLLLCPGHKMYFRLTAEGRALVPNVTVRSMATEAVQKREPIAVLMSDSTY